MRSDNEGREAYVRRQIESLEHLGDDVLVGFDGDGGSRIIAGVRATYLGIHGGAPRISDDEDPLLAPLRAGLWEPQDASQIRPVSTVIHVGIDVLGPEGRPHIMVLPGAYPPILHPHVTPSLPAGVCLMDDFRPDTTDLADVIIGLVRMLRYDEGTYSLNESDALAPGVSRWLAAGAIEQFDLPISTSEPYGIRVLETAEEDDGDE